MIVILKAAQRTSPKPGALTADRKRRSRKLQGFRVRASRSLEINPLAGGVESDVEHSRFHDGTFSEAWVGIWYRYAGSSLCGDAAEFIGAAA